MVGCTSRTQPEANSVRDDLLFPAKNISGVTEMKGQNYGGKEISVILKIKTDNGNASVWVRKLYRKINETQSRSFERINKIDKILERLTHGGKKKDSSNKSLISGKKHSI